MANNKKVEEHAHWPFWRRHWFFRAVFWAVIVVAITTAFVVGTCIGFLRSGDFVKGLRFHANFDKEMMFGGKNMMFWYDEDEGDLAYVFGMINNIIGSQITVVDNGEKEQVILSLSDTVITKDGTQISVRDLRTGHSIAVWGTAAAEGHIQAKMIRVYSDSSAVLGVSAVEQE